MSEVSSSTVHVFSGPVISVRVLGGKLIDGGGGSVSVNPINGVAGDTIQEVLEELAIAALPKEADFTDADLSVAGVLPFTHNLNTMHPTIELWDSIGARASPDGITIVNANSIGVNMASYRPLSGNFHIKVSK